MEGQSPERTPQSITLSKEAPRRHGSRWLAVSLCIIAIGMVSFLFCFARHSREGRRASEIEFRIRGARTSWAILHRCDWMSFAHTAVSDDDLRDLTSFPALKTLDLQSTAVGDAGMAHLSGLSGLNKLLLSNTRVTDAGLAHLKGLKNLERLELVNTEITDAGLARLKELKRLQWLEIAATNITGKGLTHLTNLPNLSRLGLAQTQVNDQDLEVLKRMNRLTAIRLDETGVTEQGLRELQQALPSTTIYFVQRSAEPAGPPPRITRPIPFGTPEADAILAKLQVFPPDNPWNQDVSGWRLHPDSKTLIASIGADKPFRHNSDMGFIFVPPDQPPVPVKITLYPDESDKGPFPVPDDVPIEGWPVGYQGKRVNLADVQRDRLQQGGDRHAIVIDSARGRLYEFYQMLKTPAGWQCSQASVFDLNSNKLRPEGWTSADAAGLPVFAGTVRYDELQRGMVQHAIRVTVRRTRRAYVHPATHFASRSNDPALPRMGERIRLRQDFPIDGFSPHAQAVLKGLKKYGMLVADNGLDWAISVAPDPRIRPMHEEFRRVKGSDFEVVVAP